MLVEIEVVLKGKSGAKKIFCFWMIGIIKGYAEIIFYSWFVLFYWFMVRNKGRVREIWMGFSYVFKFLELGYMLLFMILFLIFSFFIKGWIWIERFILFWLGGLVYIFWLSNIIFCEIYSIWF